MAQWYKVTFPRRVCRRSGVRALPPAFCLFLTILLQILCASLSSVYHAPPIINQ